MFDLILLLKCLGGRSLISSLISFQLFAPYYGIVNDSIVCYGFWEGIHVSHCRRKSCIVVIGIFYCSEKILKISWKKIIVTFVHEKAMNFPE